MDRQKIKFAIITHDGVVLNITKSTISTPKPQYNGQVTKWFDDSKLIKRSVNHDEI